MSISRLARTHLVYQFIILTILIIGFGYHELLPLGKHWLAAGFLIVFVYQLVIFAYYAEMLPIPGWMNLDNRIDASKETSLTKESCDTSDSSSLHLAQKSSGNIGAQLPNNQFTSSSTTCSPPENIRKSTRIYRLRHSNTEISDQDTLSVQSPSFNFNTCTSGVSCGSSVRKSNSFKESGLTKQYFFPYRQKRLEGWIETKENTRPFKLRSSEINRDEEQSNFNIPDENEISTVEGSEDERGNLAKSYSFPLRQRRLDKSSDLSDSIASIALQPKSTNVPAVNKAKWKRRKSFANFLEIDEFQDENSCYNDKADNWEPNQSTELSSNLNKYNVSGKSLKGSSSNLNKMKFGFTNYFTKNNKKNSDCGQNKKRDSNKVFPLKRMFMSRENIHV